MPLMDNRFQNLCGQLLSEDATESRAVSFDGSVKAGDESGARYRVTPCPSKAGSVIESDTETSEDRKREADWSDVSSLLEAELEEHRAKTVPGKVYSPDRRSLVDYHQSSSRSPNEGHQATYPCFNHSKLSGSEGATGENTPVSLVQPEPAAFERFEVLTEQGKRPQLRLNTDLHNEMNAIFDEIFHTALTSHRSHFELEENIDADDVESYETDEERPEDFDETHNKVVAELIELVKEVTNQDSEMRIGCFEQLSSFRPWMVDHFQAKDYPVYEVQDVSQFHSLTLGEVVYDHLQKLYCYLYRAETSPDHNAIEAGFAKRVSILNLQRNLRDPEDFREIYGANLCTGVRAPEPVANPQVVPGSTDTLLLGQAATTKDKAKKS